MDIVNLVSYIQEGTFLDDAVLPYDLIVRENMPVDLSDAKHMHRSFADISYDFGLSGQMSALSSEYGNILVIVETINMLYLLPRIQNTDSKSHITILNLSCGLASYLKKSTPEMDDVSLLLSHIAVKDVWDAESLRLALTAGGKQYIRVPSGDIPEKFFPKKLDYENGIGDLLEQGFEGIAGTVLAPGGMLVHSVHGVQQLQDEGVFHDLFLLGEYDFTITAALKDSIVRTGKLIVLLDQRFHSSYEQTVKSKLRDAGLSAAKVFFLTPDTRKINTILPEYLWEQARRDGAGIAAQIAHIHS